MQLLNYLPMHGWISVVLGVMGVSCLALRFAARVPREFSKIYRGWRDFIAEVRGDNDERRRDRRDPDPQGAGTKGSSGRTETKPESDSERGGLKFSKRLMRLRLG